MKFLKTTFYRLMFLGLGIVLIGPFFIKDGENPMMSLSDLMPDFATKALGIMEDTSSAASEAMTEQVYFKWKDKNGNWQITATPPPAGISGQQINVNTNNNILQSMSQEKIDRALGRNQDTASAGGGVPGMGGAPNIKIPDLSSLPIPLPTSVPTEDIGALLQNAQQVQQMANDRQKMMDKFSR